MQTATETVTPAGQPDAARKPGRALHLREATSALHAQVDAAMMAGESMKDREHYAQFLIVQYRFHQLTRHYFRDPILNGWLPGLAERERLAALEQDCRDLGLTPEHYLNLPLATPRHAAGRATALGWLYVTEGSNLGAAFLYKAAQALGLDAGFGARHLAPHADGRALHWKTFVAQLDAAPVGDQYESLVVEGAQAAFLRVIALAQGMAQG